MHPMQSTHVLLSVVLAGGGLAASGGLLQGQEPAPVPFVRGDVNADGSHDVSDVVSMLFCSFLGSKCSSCADSSDSNEDGKLDVADAIFLLNFLFLGADAPPAPFEACGTDATDDELSCESFPRCDVSNPDAVPTSRGDLIVAPVDHASLALLWDGKTVLADPVGGSAKYASFPTPDLIVVTHTHGDHLNAATIRGLAGDQTVLVVPQAVATSIAGSGGAGKATVRILANGEKTTAGDIGVEAIAMYNITQGRVQNHPKGQGNGYVLDFAGTRVYVCGDTEDIVEMRSLPNIALAFICMNLPFTMTPDQAASAVLEFKPRVVYPYHYRGQDTGRFRTLVEAGSNEIDVRLRDWYPSE